MGIGRDYLSDPSPKGYRSMSMADDYDIGFNSEDYENLRNEREKAMNFQIVDALQGRADEKGYQQKTLMGGKVGQVWPAEFNKNGKRQQQVMITDVTGKENKVKIFLGQNPDILTGSQGDFLVGPNPYKGNMYYNGFIEGSLQGGTQAPQQPQQQSYQQPQQQYQQPAQASQPKRQATLDKDRLIVAQVVYKALQDGSGVNEALLKEHVDMIFRVAENRPAQQAPLQTQPLPQDTTDYFPDDDNIPF